MFEAVELGRKVNKEEYKALLPELRAGLLQAQFALSKTNAPVIIIISGVNAAGRGETVNALNEWLDTRGLETISLDTLTDEERERPYGWRFWRNLPARGRVGVFFGGWYADIIDKYAMNEVDLSFFDESLVAIRRFENMLVEDGAIIFKFWLHLSQKSQAKRLKKLEKDPNSIRSVSSSDWELAEHYDAFARAAERAIRHTDSGAAPWTLVEATDERYRNITVARTILETLQKFINYQEKSKQADSLNALQSAEQLRIDDDQIAPSNTLVAQFNTPLTILDRVDLNQSISGKKYNEELSHYQGKLHRLSWLANHEKLSTVIVFEGWDAAGKGGAIRRLTQALDARLYRVISTAAPTDEERAHHYLWRFWRHVPRAGRFTLYDRSWYGRVLVERVEGFAQEHEWKRAYLEINSFEEQLVESFLQNVDESRVYGGGVVIKFWLHISKEEQLRRFEEREVIAYKQHKITSEDWRNREKWDKYALAVNDMVSRTSTDYAPWKLIAANDKQWARIEVLKTVCECLEKALDTRKQQKK
ncbi:polyphosphate:AMP phosphotransferase [Beggiatoa alba B18LD]|uniref:Polyphosphate:AMP phosphotransferase n=1 Tax=Beggiatoa alba B18LD TaxID=395493 RepID=I3CGY9_9GAMM|nr:polyphosphate:AMP phosphotransferase [Beggiatoa alba]EIJ42882.1 polyphosphate:AMP phosphotransferase [Beggiatoa alba B18LD]